MAKSRTPDVQSSEAYKKNHYVPRFMLKHWLVKPHSVSGIHVHNVSGGQTTFEKITNRTKEPYSFAIVDDLYVPIVEGIRAVGLETSLGNLERVMASVTHQAHARKEVRLRSPMDFTKFTMGIFCLEARSKAYIRKMEEIVGADPALRGLVTAAPERSTHQVVLENLIHFYTEMANLHPFLEFNFIHAGAGKSFIIGDRPCVNADELGRFVVLTNKVAVRFIPASEWSSYSNHVDATDDFLDLVNHLQAVQARDWLVADSREQLERYLPVIGSKEWLQSWANIRIEVIRPRTNSTGWTINR